MTEKTPQKKPEGSLEVPYLGNSGRPFHRLSEAERRWYTKGVLSEQDATELTLYSAMIEERVKQHQAKRHECRKKSHDLIRFREDTPPEERQRKLAEVDKLKEEYRDAEEAIKRLKGMVFTITPGEPLSLEPME